MCLKENQCGWWFLTWSLPLCGSYGSFFDGGGKALAWKRSASDAVPEGCVMNSKHFSRSLLTSVFTLKQWIGFSQRSLIGSMTLLPSKHTCSLTPHWITRSWSIPGLFCTVATHFNSTFKVTFSKTKTVLYHSFTPWLSIPLSQV